jgi:glutamyl-tRNA synthetase
VPFIAAKGYAVPGDERWLEKMIAALRERARTLTELVDAAHFFLADEITVDEKAAKKFLTPEIAGPMSRLTEKLSATDNFEPDEIERVFSSVLEETALPMGKLAQPVRVALTGGTVSPGIHEVIAVLGKERTLRRLRAVLQRIES